MYECKYGASNGDRTRMVFKPRDFKSLAYAKFRHARIILNINPITIM